MKEENTQNCEKQQKRGEEWGVGVQPNLFNGTRFPWGSSFQDQRTSPNKPEI